MRDPSVTALILEALKYARPEGDELSTRCPFPQCDGKRKRTFYYNPQKNVWHCFRCEESGVLNERAMPMSPRQLAERVVASEKRKRNTVKSALQIFEHSYPIQPGDPVDLYLRQTRKLEPVFSSIWTTELRFAPKLWHKEAQASFPGLVAGVRNKYETIVGIHRYFLTPEGKKANVEPQRKMLGEVMGNAVRLGPANYHDILVAEGIESTLAAMRKLKRPGWAALSAAGLAQLEIPRSIKHVLIVPDHDDVGFYAAQTLFDRLRKDNYKVDLYDRIPPKGTDWADV